MAIDFPNSPTLNQIYQSGNKTWIYDGEKWNVYIVTGVVDTTPVGSLQIYAGSTAPTGWLLSFGQALSRTAYAGLFTVIGTTYGVGDGSTTFNLPDLRGRVPAGVDNMGGSAASRLTSGGAGITGTTLGAVGGTETHTLTSAQSGAPAHSHANTASFSGTSGSSGSMSANASHTHASVYNGAPSGGTLDGSLFAYGTTADLMWRGVNISSTNTDHSHSFTPAGSVTVTNVNNTAANASSAHNNTQPTIVMNYIIKYGPA